MASDRKQNAGIIDPAFSETSVPLSPVLTWASSLPLLPTYCIEELSMILMTSSAACARLQCSSNDLDRLVSTSVLAPVILGDKTFIFSEEIEILSDWASQALDVQEAA